MQGEVTRAMRTRLTMRDLLAVLLMVVAWALALVAAVGIWRLVR